MRITDTLLLFLVLVNTCNFGKEVHVGVLLIHSNVPV